MLLKLLALGGLGYAGYRYYEKNKSQPAFAANQGDAAVRDAGPGAMRDKPDGDWSKTDEASDESFPASDPPANY
ncbi:hypothetical protein K3181_08075 [Qipengyuania sp. YG27]|uniref:Uncharacterized protein n=1 Tax=Qipengyuania mesophila TaxID=2867246 RepID=A0ABS7JUR6_9SPHN|nr:hypothetical protein [Qipengyuania mesophila]MBX7501395.1 hypothetical protein [Qipengyuania mesophila]